MATAIYAHDIMPGTKIVTKTGTILTVLDKGTAQGIIRMVRSTTTKVRAQCYIADWARTEDGATIMFTPDQQRAIAQGG